jgi:hypothetical protein
MELLSDIVLYFSIGCFFLMVIGFFSPSKALFWYKGDKTRKSSSLIYLISFIGLMIISALILPSDVKEKRRIENEELTLKREEEKLRLAELAVEEERKLEEEQKKIEQNTPIFLQDINDFKDYPEKYLGKILIADCTYDEKNGLKLKELIKGSKNDTIPIYFNLSKLLDGDYQQLEMKMDFPTNLQVPNITGTIEDLQVTFKFTKGDFYSGNKVISLTRK